VDIQVNTEISISAEKLIKNMGAGDIAELLNAVALKLDDCHIDRASAADAFSENLSETGSRFLAEIVALRCRRRD
jgi:hypothetical protein